jgi:drug/metabolite transporter (DMT)-like permease
MSVTERRSRLDGQAVALILGCCLIWGLNQVVMKVTLPVFPPLMQGALRSLIAAAFVGWWARRRGIALWPADGGNRAGVLAGVVFAVEFCCVYWGLQFTTASRATVFLYLAPFVVAIGMPFISASERLRPIQVVGLCLAFGGLAATFHEGFAAGSGAPKGQWLGDLLAVGGAVFWDTARAWGPGSGDEGWHHDTGFGLRLSLPHSSLNAVARFDVSWPIVPDIDGRRGPAFSFGSGQAF